MPLCVQCGRELDEKSVTAGESTCEPCRQREFAEHAEQEALRGSQYEFIVTNVLLAINIGVYVWMVFFKHVSPTSPSTDQIIHWGGNYGPMTFGTEPWRLFTALFLHIGFIHLLANMWALFVLGRLAESLYGRWSYLISYLIAGLAGSVASLLWNPLGVSAGASGAIFGIAGALIATFYVGKLPLPKANIRYILLTLIAFAGFDLLYGIWKTGVDNAAHIGGFVVGLVLGLLLGHHLGPSRKAKVFRERLFLAAVMFVFLFAVFVWRKDGYVADVERARVLINNGVVGEAIKELQVVAVHKPDEPYVLLLMGQAYAKKGDYPKAEQEYKRITQLKPDHPLGWNDLAEVYAAEGKFPESAAAWVQVAELSKNNGAFAWFNVGQTYSHIDKQDDAIKAYQKAIALSPNSAELWGAMGFAQLKARQNEQAVASLEHAVKLQPGSPDLRLILGNAYLEVGKQQEAQEQFFQASKLRAAMEQHARQMMQNKKTLLQPVNPTAPKK